MSRGVAREMGWPLQPGAVPSINELIAEISDEIAEVTPEFGGTIVLIEVGELGREELHRLAGRLAEHWENQGLMTLVVDAHPAAPFTAGFFEDDPEGFTELLHYGLSPERVSRGREGVAGMWVPAGAPWSLALELPEEPARSLRRLADTADRILLLASAGDEEGLLASLREAAQYRLILTEAATAAAEPDQPHSPQELSLGEAISLQPEAPARASEPAGVAAVSATGGEGQQADRLDGPEEFTLDMDGGRRRKRLLPLLGLLVVVLVVAWLWKQNGGLVGEDRESARLASESSSGFTPLPEQVESPYHSSGGMREGEEKEPGEAMAPAIKATGEANETEVPPESETPSSGADESAAVSSSEPMPDQPALKVPAAARAAVSRRYESRGNWRSVLDHDGSFFVHVESYQDSALGALSARRRGFDRAGFLMSPTSVKGGIWYRLHVGPFADLANTCAYRDSLLDQAGVDYCVVAANRRP